ncbi:hypothetical protein, partial [Microvirga lenta]|uniref:hypothetical protein n=1 Tax=Microvirga lenta TaxID=2881337 RepID=UPI001CFF5D13
MINAFSDGNPVYEAFVFLALFLAFLVVAPLRLGRPWGWAAVAGVVRFSRKRRVLPEHDLLLDLRKIDLARILTGILATWRYAEVFWQQIAFGDARAAFIGGSALVLSILVMFGLLTPAAVLVLMATANILIDNSLGASTLGTQVLSMLLL